jgi:hypothetical protein
VDTGRPGTADSQVGKLAWAGMLRVGVLDGLERCRIVLAWVMSGVEI